jgi:hypothetical protein
MQGRGEGYGYVLYLEYIYKNDFKEFQLWVP